MYSYWCKILKVVDGDTVDVLLDVGFGIWMKERVRLNGIDAPESRTRDKREKKFGLMAKAKVDHLLKKAAKYSQRPGHVEYRSTDFTARGRYRRLLGDFEISGAMGFGDPEVEPVLLTDVLLTYKLAVPYEGGSRNEGDHRARHEANWQKLEEDDLSSSDSGSAQETG